MNGLAGTFVNYDGKSEEKTPKNLNKSIGDSIIQINIISGSDEKLSRNFSTKRKHGQ